MSAANARDLLESAIVTTPQPGQLLLAIEFRQAYATSSSTVLVDLKALPPELATALRSSDNSCSTVNTWEGVGLFSKLSAMARAVRKRSYKLIAAVTSASGAVRRNTRNRASNLSTPSLTGMASSSLLCKRTDGKAAEAFHSSGGAA